MHHLYPLAKGDPLCPLGFHPQVRWPTRCKRCFRDYKEHGGKKKEEDMTVSTPSLSTWNSSRRSEEPSPSRDTSIRGWVSSQNLSQEPAKNEKTDPFSSGFTRSSATWTSTPDLGNVTEAVTVSLTLPRKRPTPIDTGQNTTETQTVVLRRPSGTPPPPSPTTTPSLVITKNDSLAERVRKMQALKARSNSIEKEKSVEKETNKKDTSRDVSKEREKSEKVVKPVLTTNSKDNDVNFLIKIKSARTSTSSRPPLRGGPKPINGSISPRDSDSDASQDDDTLSTAGTSTTSTTLVDHAQYNFKEVQDLREEVETLRKRCEKVEKEKSEILLRRLASLDSSTSKTSSRPSELLKLQQKVNELSVQNEDLKDEKKSLQIRIREIEAELEAKQALDTSARTVEQLRAKLRDAETLCEELMDENEDMKRELRSMEEEIEEMQDNFREDQADEYSSIRKELEQTTKNCRVLSFKLKKNERKAEQLEQEKLEHEKKLLELAGGQVGMDKVNKIKQLEQELAMSNEVALRLQRELQEANSKLAQQPAITAKKAPAIGLIGKSQSTDSKPSRASLTRGGSQEDPQQLLRDLQDSLEREADLREQLKNAEEEAGWYRQRHGGGRISPTLQRFPHHPSSHPDLIPSSRLDEYDEDESEPIDQNTAQRLHVLQMQLALGKHQGTFDKDAVFLGINEAIQSTIVKFCCGTQTDLVMCADVQCNTDEKVDAAVQYSDERITSFGSTQTDTFDAESQTLEPETSCQASQTVIHIEVECQTFETIGQTTLTDIECQTDESDCQRALTNIECQTSNVTCNQSTQMDSNNLTKGTMTEVFKRRRPLRKQTTRNAEDMMSPPLSPDFYSSEHFQPPQMPFVSVYHSFGAGLPSLGIRMANPNTYRVVKFQGSNLRKRASRVEDDNESLVLQLKKMATKARTRKLSPTAPTNRLTIENSVEKDEGISDEEDPAELRILLELNEQEASVLRRKVEELEHEGESLKTQVKDLSDKLANSNIKTTPAKKFGIASKTNSLTEEKVKILEGDLADLRKKLIEKERDVERLHAELSVTQKRSKGSLMKSKSLDGASEQQNVDLKRQLQLIEQETSILRTKTQTLESDNEKLQAENKKLQLLRGTKTLKSDKSIEQTTEKINQLEKELKEANEKIKTLEAKEPEKTEKKVSFVTSKKDAEALKAKTEELDKLKVNMKKVETEKNQLSDLLKELKEDAVKSFKPRTPKRPTDLTTKLQMKKMVEELESEIGELYVVMRNAELNTLDKTITVNKNLQKSIEELRDKIGIQEKSEAQLKSEIDEYKETAKKYEKEKKTLTDNNTACQKERDEAIANYKSMQDKNKKLDAQIAQLNADLKTASSKQTAVSDCMKKIEDLKKDIEDKDKQVEKMKKDLSGAAKVEEDKNKLLKEVGDKAKKITELEKKVKDAEDRCKRTDKMLNVRKERVAKLEKELSEEKEQNDNVIESQRRMSVEWSSEKDSLMIQLITAESKLDKVESVWKEKMADLEGKVVTFESQLAAKNFHIKQLEDSLSEVSSNQGENSVSPVELAQVKELLETTRREVTLKEQEISTLRSDIGTKAQECNKLQDELSGSKQELLKLQNERKDSDVSMKNRDKEVKHMESKISELEIDYQAEKKKCERMKNIHDKDLKNKELELATLKGKLRTLEQTSGAGSKKIEDLKKEYDAKLKTLETDLTSEKKEYDELTSKYELLEEEHVVMKAKLTIEKESAQGEVSQMQRDFNSLRGEHKSLQDTYNNKTDAWIKEKIELQEKLSTLEDRLCGGGWEVEKARLTAKLDQKEREVDQISRERDVTNHQQETLKRETEELRKKLDDYDKVSKVQRNLTLENTNMEKQLNMLKNKLESAEKSKKSEVSECKLRYESQMQSMQDELQSVQTQVARFKRERDTFKQMLDGAHKTMSDMKANGGSAPAKNNKAAPIFDELEESKSKIEQLQEQIGCLEDGLCEARMESSRTRTELVSERSSFEIRLSEMQSKLNEFEEERLVTSGRTKIPGLKTRLELAWQKEREEQQRLLQETSTLARDLRQTLFEMERERDKEKLDMKRRCDQLKKTAEEETDESKKKVTELQCDLLELRDAHAKLRTTNEKLRREKERHDRERDQHKMSIATLKRSQQDEDKKIGYLLDLVDELTKGAGDDADKVSHTPHYLTPTPPRRNRSSKSRSREATPEDSGAESGSSVLAKLRSLSQEVRASQLSDRQRRQSNMRRAASTEPSNTAANSSTSRTINGRTSSLKKRSISLEQTTQEQGKIWKTDEDSMSSLQSLDADILDSRIYTMQRESSMDSRLSGGSTQSDIMPSGKKKKKGIFGKLKQLTKSHSIDDSVEGDVSFPPIGSVSQGGSDSDMSMKGSKKDLRGRLSGMFSSKKSSGSSSSINKEKKKELSTPVATRSASLQRPLTNNGSTGQLDTTPSSTTSTRAMSVTPGLQRKNK